MHTMGELIYVGKSSQDVFKVIGYLTGRTSAVARRFCVRVVFKAVSYRGSFLFGREDGFPVILRGLNHPAMCLRASNPIL